MKLCKFYTVSLVALFFTIDPAQAKQPSTALTRLSSTGIPEMVNAHHPLPAAASSNWFAQVSGNIQQLENAFYPSNKKHHYSVANAANRITFRIHTNGYSVHQVKDQYQQTGWKMHFNILGAARKKMYWSPSTDCRTETDHEQLRYSWSNMEVQYTNDQEGLRQNFIIYQKPAGNAPIRMRINITGDLKASLTNNRLSFRTSDSAAETVLLYEDLKVWDNRYQPLPARMKLKGSILIIEVDATHAQYPITIDPINRSPDWKTNTNGLLAGLGLTGPQILTSLYGYAVCGVGDVNDDGFGDVAVSAPGLIGVLNGFGFSVAVTEDLNNDGKQDIIVGTPAYVKTDLILLSTTTGAAFVYLTGKNSNNFSNVLQLEAPVFNLPGILDVPLLSGISGLMHGFSVDGAGDFNGDGAPGYKVSATYGDEFLSVNATALFGFSVTAVQKITDPVKASLSSGRPLGTGASGAARLVVGSPFSALDFSSSLLNLNSTLGTVLNFAAGSNGLGKPYSFDAPAITLPVSIVSIKAALKNTAVKVSWDVREELNLHLYEVERSIDGSQFEKIGLVFPWDNQQVANSYRFSDQHPFSGMNFYRLRIVDKDGSFKYSNIVSARTGGSPVNNISIAPNPVKGNIRAIFSGLRKGVYVVELRNVSGQLQLMRNVNIQQTDQVEFFERGNAAAGIYWMTVLDNNGKKMSTGRVIIQ